MKENQVPGRQSNEPVTKRLTYDGDGDDERARFRFDLKHPRKAQLEYIEYFPYTKKAQATVPSLVKRRTTIAPKHRQLLGKALTLGLRQL